MTVTEQTEETQEGAPEGQEGTQTPPEPQEGSGDAQEPADDAETFPREYVERLRREAAGHRERAQRADTYGQRLHVQLVAATGRLADPTDLPYDESHLDDADALTAAVDELLARKPHLASRRPTGDVGQGVSAIADSVDLAGLLRARAS